MGSEEDAHRASSEGSPSRHIAMGKVTAEDFEKDSAATPTAQYEAWVAALDGSLESIDSLRVAVR